MYALAWGAAEAGIFLIGFGAAFLARVVVAGARFSEIQGPGIHEGLTVLTGRDDLAPAPAALGVPGMPPGGPR